MDALKGYCYSLIVITVCTAVVMLIAPEKSGLMKYVRWLTALCVTATLIIPLKNIGSDINIDIAAEYTATTEDQKSGRDLILSALSDEIASSVKNVLLERFKLVCGDVEVKIKSDESENVSIDKIIVSVSEKSRFLISDVKKHLEDIFMCDIEVRQADE